MVSIRIPLTGIVVSLVLCILPGMAAAADARAPIEGVFRLPKTERAQFILSVAELRDAIKKLEARVDRGRRGMACDECNDIAPTDAEERKRLAKDKERQERFRSEVREILTKINDLEEEAREVVLRVREQTSKIGWQKLLARKSRQAEAKDKKGKKVDKEKRQETRVVAARDRQTQFLDDILKPLLNKINAERAKLYRKVQRRDKDGLSWIARGLVADNSSLVNYLRKVGGVEGTLRSELLSASRSGNTRAVNALLTRGADVSQDPGKYSALALADIFGHRRISRMLRRNGATVQVPWDPHRKDSFRASLRMVESQLARVESFSARRGLALGKRERGTYYDQLMKQLRCQVECLKRSAVR